MSEEVVEKNPMEYRMLHERACFKLTEAALKGGVDKFIACIGAQCTLYEQCLAEHCNACAACQTHMNNGNDGPTPEFG
jgi:hypothetical protein